MGAVYFYHLTASPLHETLPMLLGKARQAGWPVAVRAVADERLRWLDDSLWQGPADGFLPHGVAGGEFDTLQPILLCNRPGAANGARCLMAVDGADVAAAEVQELDRVCILFDGNDFDALQRARGQWKALTGAGCSAQYWSQETGRWEKKAES